MNVLDSVSIAVRALRTNLLRSVLTTLGIVIGVASVIILVAVGTGASSEVDKQIKALGTNMLVVFPGSMRVMGRAGGAGTDIPLSETDVAGIRDKIPGVIAVSGQIDDSGPIVRGNANWISNLNGVHAEYTMVRDWPIASGRDIDPADVRSGTKVAVIGDTVAKEVFAGENPVGAIIRIRNVPFEVIGVLVPKGQSVMGRDQDDVVLVPITTARLRVSGRSQVQNDRVGRLYVKVDESANIDEVQEDIENFLRQRRKTRAGADDSFSVRNLAETMKARSEVLTTLSYLLAATSVISLIVGGIGIMNIMLVSVTERTREIGLRMAVGARRRDIMLQFLVEAVSLCLLGGLIGIAVGVSASAVIAFAANWPVLVSPAVLGGALAAAAATGICFGLFPARRAAHLNPIDALRSE
ncbi:ABC transporter permease [Hyphomicrobium sp. CS1GBMeth3]|uniref:ABC transporter permease n=1 Tax=Hyphomicrobium sp. CS1GBMeth3 TaxID=1892845 RepID=UPI00092FE6FC|nr:ABC transporter permease [Hyphomicrobium sp. CS1GBMeth3]